MSNEWDSWKEHGVTSNTPDSILFGAGTIHTGLQFSNGSWNFASTIIGATNGGSKLSIKPEVQDIELDGKFVKTKGLVVKTGETATMEINFAELKADLIKKSVFAKEGTSDATGYTMLESKPDIETGDYYTNFAFVGRTVTKKPIIVIFDTALVTSGLEVDNKHKEQGNPVVTVECYADISSDDGLKTLPYHIYYPTGTTTQSSQTGQTGGN